VRAASGGLPRVDFEPMLRFDPAKTAYLTLSVKGRKAKAAAEMRILYCQTNMAKDCVDEALMDPSLEPEVMREIDKVLEGFRHQAIRFDHVATRRAGRRRFIDLHMHMPAGWTLGRAAALRTDVEQALMSAVPGLRASIQLLPTDVEAHFHDVKDPL